MTIGRVFLEIGSVATGCYMNWKDQFSAIWKEIGLQELTMSEKISGKISFDAFQGSIHCGQMANLTGADLTGADLTGANLTNNRVAQLQRLERELTARINFNARRLAEIEPFEEEQDLADYVSRAMALDVVRQKVQARLGMLLASHQ